LRGGGGTFSVWVNTVYKHKHSLVFLYTYFPSPLQKLAFSKKKSYRTLSCAGNISDISITILFSSASSCLKFTSLPYDYNYGQFVSYLAFLYQLIIRIHLSLVFTSLQITFQLTSGCHHDSPIHFDACNTIHTSLVSLNHLYLIVFKYLPKFIWSLSVYHNIVL